MNTHKKTWISSFMWVLVGAAIGALFTASISNYAKHEEKEAEIIERQENKLPTSQPATLGVEFTKEMEVTAYCPCDKCCGKYSDGVTASGASITEHGGKFVAAPKAFPFWTMIEIPGYSDRAVPVLDRGGAIKGNRLDVFFPTHEEALEWGRRTVVVKIFG